MTREEEGTGRINEDEIIAGIDQIRRVVRKPAGVDLRKQIHRMLS